jgi:hypothetical protein
MELNIPAEIERLSKEYFEHQKMMFQIEGQIKYLQGLLTEIQKEKPVENVQPAQMQLPLNES